MGSFLLVLFVILGTLFAHQISGSFPQDDVAGFISADSGIPFLGQLIIVPLFYCLYAFFGACYLGHWQRLATNGSLVFFLFRFILVPYASLTCILRFDVSIIKGNYTAVILFAALWLNYVLMLPYIFSLTEKRGLWGSQKNQKIFARYPPKTRGDLWKIDFLFLISLPIFLVFPG